MQKISIINQKGGVGKSTTALAIGSDLYCRGYRVLFIDLDAQGNLTYSLKASTEFGSLGVLQAPETVKAKIQHTEQGDIIGSSLSLAGADALITQTGKEYRLKEALNLLESDYDYCIIDTPPALGITTVNALTASNAAIIPAQADIYSLIGIMQLGSTVEAVKKYCNPGLIVKGIVLTRFNGRSVIRREAAEMLEQAAAQLETKVYKARIRECTALVEAQARRQSIFKYAPRSNAAADYTALVNEILAEEEKQ